MTEDDKKELFALSSKKWESLTDQEKLEHLDKFESDIDSAIINDDPEDAGFRTLDWSFIQEHKNELNLELNDEDKLSIFEEEADELISTIDNDTGEDILWEKYQVDEGKSFSENERIELVNNYLSGYGIEFISSWFIAYRLDERLEREYKLTVGNHFYNSWYAEDYYQKTKEELKEEEQIRIEKEQDEIEEDKNTENKLRDLETKKIWDSDMSIEDKLKELDKLNA